MTAQPSTVVNDTSAVVADLIRWLETGSARDGLFAPDVFLDLSLPLWRIQSDSRQGAIAVRSQGHPFPGTVRIERVEQTGHGFTLEFEERWDHEGQEWYSRELMRVEVAGGQVAELAVYCTGDWDQARQAEHAAAVTLLRP